ncbi:MAG: Gfo/Idh/MocA family oxidoreductase, partial [Pseudomonadota bacterium]
FFMRDWRRFSAQSGGVMLEKACHDIDLYNWIVGSRPVTVASFGGRASFVPENAPDDLSQILDYVKQPTGTPPSNPYTTDGDIIDHQTALMAFENGVSMTFHLSLNAPEQQRRFGIFGTHGMAVGDFFGLYLRITGRDEAVPGQSFTYNGNDPEDGHYGADTRMAEEVAAHLRGEGGGLPVSSIDALVAGIVCLALDEARLSGRMVDLSETWARLDGYFRA